MPYGRNFVVSDRLITESFKGLHPTNNTLNSVATSTPTVLSKAPLVTANTLSLEVRVLASVDGWEY